MKCQADIQKIADNKFLAAVCLFSNGFYDEAYYLGGYSIELLLKARACKTLGIDDFFTFKRGVDQTKRGYKTHNYQELIILSGIYGEFEQAQKDLKFKGDWSIIQSWSEEARYLTGHSKKDVEDFLTSVEEISEWIKKYL